MAENSRIGWTDHTFNPWTGYDPVEMRWRWADDNPTVDWKAKYPWLRACKRCDPPSPLTEATT